MSLGDQTALPAPGTVGELNDYAREADAEVTIARDPTLAVKAGVRPGEWGVMISSRGAVREVALATDPDLETAIRKALQVAKG